MQLATYTADSAGNLTTSSTYKNMPQVAVGWVSNLNMSPSGKVLAVGGSLGLQLFHYNGAKPITPYTGLIGTEQFDQFRWDNYNHLYAINASTGHLHIFTITPTSVSEAPGSPYTIPGGGGMGAPTPSPCRTCPTPLASRKTGNEVAGYARSGCAWLSVQGLPSCLRRSCVDSEGAERHSAW
jgi:hypothetical protein